MAPHNATSLFDYMSKFTNRVMCVCQKKKELRSILITNTLKVIVDDNRMSYVPFIMRRAVLCVHRINKRDQRSQIHPKAKVAHGVHSNLPTC